MSLVDFGGPVSAPKPRDYHDRRRWQDEARARGEVPECGREVCHAKADPAWVNSGTPLLYCPTCAALINRYTARDGFRDSICTPEVATPSETP